MLVQTLDDRIVKSEALLQNCWKILAGFKVYNRQAGYLFAKEQFEDLIKIGPPSVDILARGLHDEDSG